MAAASWQRHGASADSGHRLTWGESRRTAACELQGAGKVGTGSRDSNLAERISCLRIFLALMRCSSASSKRSPGRLRAASTERSGASWSDHKRSSILRSIASLDRANRPAHYRATAVAGPPAFLHDNQSVTARGPSSSTYDHAGPQGDEPQAASTSIGAGSITSMTNAEANSAQRNTKKITGVFGSRPIGKKVGTGRRSTFSQRRAQQITNRLAAHHPYE